MSSKRRQAIPDCSRSPCRGRAAEAHARADGSVAPPHAADRGDARRRRRPGQRSRRRAGSGSTIDSMPTGVATLRHGLVSMARLARAAGASEIVAAGSPPAWFGRDGTSFEFGSKRRWHRSTSAPTAGRCSRPTRWGPCAWAPIRRPSVRSGRTGPRRCQRGRRRAGTLRGRRLPVPDRHRGQSDDHDHGARTAGDAGDPSRDLSEVGVRESRPNWRRGWHGSRG